MNELAKSELAPCMILHTKTNCEPEEDVVLKLKLEELSSIKSNRRYFMEQWNSGYLEAHSRINRQVH